MSNNSDNSPKTEDRNIINYYHYWDTDAIKADLDTKRHNFSILCSNLYNDFNIATVIRNSNAFMAKDVYIYGSKRFDRRGTVGTHIYQNLKHVKDINALDEIPKDFVWIGMDNIGDATPVETFDWPKDKHVLICLGQEQVGLPQEIIDRCQKLVYIKQYGSVRSLNVGVASGIAMYDYVRKVVGDA
jgi:tRNA G18 (ribose-2'-O)-methylase SpoU